MTHDDRRSIRFPIGMKCAYRLHGVVTPPSAATMTDVSRQGCSLETTDDIGQPSEQIDIHFTVPATSTGAVLVGKVVHRMRHALGWTLGVTFAEIDPAVKWELLADAYRHWHAEHVAADQGRASPS